MKKIHKRNFTRNDKKYLLLFGYNQHREESGIELDITEIPKPHMRWNPSRNEWVTYSSGRKNRTSFPPNFAGFDTYGLSIWHSLPSH